MTNLKVLEETKDYTLFKADYKGTTQVFRKWAATQLIEIQFTDDFARATGYRSRADMLRQEPGMRERLHLYCGGIPEWVQIIGNEFCIRAINMN